MLKKEAGFLKRKTEKNVETLKDKERELQ